MFIICNGVGIGLSAQILSLYATKAAHEQKKQMKHSRPNDVRGTVYVTPKMKYCTMSSAVGAEVKVYSP